MKTRAILALAALAGTAVVANAQEAITVSIQVSNAVINPGQSTVVSVFASYAPGIGGAAVWNTLGGTGQAGTVLQFGNAIFNMLGTPGAGVTGVWSNLTLGANLQPPPGGNKGAIAGSNVNNINAGSGFQPAGGNNIANPVHLWSGTWTADAGSGTGNFGLASFVVGAVGTVNKITMLLDVGLGFGVEDSWTTTNGQGGFQVIPAPASLALLGLGGLVAGRRRR